MKSQWRWILFLLFLLTSLVPTIRITHGAPVTDIFVTPSRSSSFINGFFTVEVNISNAVGVNLWELKIRFNNSLLVVSDAKLGGFLSRVGNIIPVEVDNRSESGYVRALEVLREPVEADGNGTLVTVTFKVLGAGECLLQLSDIILDDIDLKPIPYTTTNGSFNLVAYSTGVGDSSERRVYVQSNSSVANISIDVSNKYVSFDVTGNEGTTGYANVSIPKAVLNVNPSKPPGIWQVALDGVNTGAFKTTTDENRTFVCLVYSMGEHTIRIMGNESSEAWDYLPLLLATAGVAIVIAAILVYFKKIRKAR